MVPLVACQAQTPAERAPAAAGARYQMPSMLLVTEIPGNAVLKHFYRAAEKCLGLKGNYARVRWFLTPKPWSDGQHQGLTYGMWREKSPKNKITLNAAEANDSVLIVHESTHDILSRHPEITDTALHPMPYFDGRCSPEFHAPGAVVP
jgi:hypothetical protein